MGGGEFLPSSWGSSWHSTASAVLRPLGRLWEKATPAGRGDLCVGVLSPRVTVSPRAHLPLCVSHPLPLCARPFASMHLPSSPPMSSSPRAPPSPTPPRLHTDGQPVGQVVDAVSQHHHPHQISCRGAGGQRGAVGVSVGGSGGVFGFHLHLRGRQTAQLSACGWRGAHSGRRGQRWRCWRGGVGGSYRLAVGPGPPRPPRGSLHGDGAGRRRAEAMGTAGLGGAPGALPVPAVPTVAARRRRSIPSSSSSSSSA